MNIDCIAGRIVFAVTWRDELDWSKTCNEKPVIRIVLPSLAISQPSPMCRDHGRSFLDMIMTTLPTPRFAVVDFREQPG